MDFYIQKKKKVNFLVCFFTIQAFQIIVITGKKGKYINSWSSKKKHKKKNTAI